MKKEALIVIFLLLLLIWWWNMQASAMDTILDPQTQPEPIVERYTVKRGDSIWKIARKRLPQTASNGQIMEYVIQISIDNGKDPAIIDGILESGKNDPDLIFPGEILNIAAYK
jgi:nucleoid-associated protein YgaU